MALRRLDLNSLESWDLTWRKCVVPGTSRSVRESTWRIQLELVGPNLLLELLHLFFPFSPQSSLRNSAFMLLLEIQPEEYTP